ncbi:MAG TPA: site-specific DNA-methyltransferase [Solirubrobacteraceae bacterium]|nr:site-specific DNA-methyltransferase [Solirubrobacteraceae bacterium]
MDAELNPTDGHDAIRPTPLEDRLRALQELVPEAFADNELDAEHLLEALGVAGPTRAGYGLTWPGKRDAIALLQEPTAGAVVPTGEIGQAEVSARHAIVEGENLDVLRCMYRAYLEAVDLVYIDPPYNTGKDRVYADTFRQGSGEFLTESGQVDDAGVRLVANAKTHGRYHSRWLTMMHPRLFIAHKMLRANGVLVVSIDDHEVHNLRHLLDEIFGEENFIAQLVWDKTRKNDAKLFSVGHEYLLVYAKSLRTLREAGTVWRKPHPGGHAMWAHYVELRARHGQDDSAVEEDLRAWVRGLPDDHPAKKLARYKQVDQHGPWRDRDISWPGGGGPRYDVVHPVTKQPCAVPEAGWRFAKPEEMQRQIDAGLVVFRDDHTQPPFRKAHLKPVAAELDPENGVDEATDDDSESEPEGVGMQVMGSYIHAQAQVAVRHLRQLFDGRKLFDNPKDHTVLADLFRYVLNGRDSPLVFDFFAGSGSTAEAVLSSNTEAGTDWRFVLAQMPEPTPDPSPARTANYETISQLTVDRVRRVFDALPPEAQEREPVRVLRFDGDPAPASPPATEQEMANQLALNTNAEALSDDDVLRGVWRHAQAHGISLTADVVMEDTADARTLRISDPGRPAMVAWLGESVPDDLAELLGLSADTLLVVLESALSDTSAGNLVNRCRLGTIR